MYPLANFNNPAIWIAILVVVVVLFGGQKIPELMKGLGQGKRAFEEGLKSGGPDDDELRKEKEREAEIRRRVEEEMRKGK